MLDELKSIITGWTGICSAWNDKKSKTVEDEVIYPLESAIRVLEDELESVEVLAHNVEDEIENIERTGDIYGW